MESKKRAQRLAAFAVACRARQLPLAAKDKGLRYFKDALGCMILGASSESARILKEYASQELPGSACSFIGSTGRGSASAAALVNGTAAHAFDLDDVGEGGHAGAVMLAAALAAGEETGADGKTVLHAFCTGLEVGGAIDRVLMSDGGKHYLRGWHNTATSGAIGAAACCAELYGLREEPLVSALCSAADLSCGLKKSFGSMSKHLNVGNAAKTGLMSAKLAGLGFYANPDMLETPGGFFECFTDNYSPDVFDELGRVWSLDAPRIQKLYPSCGFSHRGICAALCVRESLPADVNQIERVRIELSEGENQPLMYRRPQTGLEGAFSAEYTVAAALLDQAVTLDSFTDAMVLRPEAQALMGKIERSAFPGRAYSGTETVTVFLQDGSRYSFCCVDFPGSFRLPLTNGQLREKFIDCAGRSLKPNGGAAVLALADELCSLADIRILTKQITACVRY